ncbi:MAG: oxygen-independent coproporphyrinogen III oxidase [Gammaproteobacteria bacterium]
MHSRIVFDADLIRRYDAQGPRYTSYPTAVQFHDGFGEVDYRAAIAASNAEPLPAPLSLYVHIPFCATVCYYCACNKVITANRARALPYLERLHVEIARQGALFDADRPVDQLHWGGGTPTFLSHAQMRALMEVTRAHFNLHEDDSGEYSIEIDPRTVDAAAVAHLRALGFNRLSLGVQDFDPRVQRAVNRVQSEADTIAVIEAARACGFRSVSIDLIYGLPHQDVESFTRTLDRVIECTPDRLSIFNYAHLPQMFKTQRQIDERVLPSAASKLAILERTVARLIAAGYVYIGMDHFARPGDELALAQANGRLTRNFQGYSTHGGCDIVGLGMSSIGNVGSCYAQNARTLDDYCAAIDAGGLAVVKGVELSGEDRLRRAAITQLICHFEIDAAAFGAAHGIDFWRHFGAERAALATMAGDGLVALDDAGIRVLPAGRLLIRNICMVFDAYLGAGSHATPRFSKVI